MIRSSDWRNKLHPASLLRSNFRSKANRARRRQVGAALKIEQFEDRRLLTIAAGGVDSAYVEGVDPGSQTVATFTDDDGNTDPGLYDAQINWGDGTVSPGLVTYDAGTFIVQGDHTYSDEGLQSVSVDITESGDGDFANGVMSTATIADAPLNDTSALATPTATEGASTGLLTVATFTDDNPGDNSADMTATIFWGDGTSTTGEPVTYSGGTYSVSDSHTYADEGSYPITVDVADVGGSTLTAIGQNTVSVADAALNDTSSADNPTATEGASTGLLTVATFTDDNPGDNSADMTATIFWGDGTSTTGEPVTYIGGTYSVSDSHIYANEGSYPITVDVADVGGNTLTAIGQTTVTVVDAALNDTSAPATPTATEGASTGLLTVATFTDDNPGDQSADMTATIHWGDGTSTTGVAVSYNAGTYSVSDSHTYADEGSDPITVDVADVGGSTLTAIGQTTVTVVDAALNDTSAPATPTATEGVATGLLTVATFTDDNPGDQSADMTATIHWGDGTSTTGVAVTYNVGTYSVSDSHTYADEGSNPITVDVADVGGSTLTAIGQTTVTVTALIDTSAPATPTATEGASTGLLTVATFTDVNPGDNSADMTATIHWGDGTSTAGVAVSYDAGTYSVSGSHTYADEGSDPITVDVADVGGSTLTAIGQTTVTVVDAALSDTSTPAAPTATEGASTGLLTVATFTDDNPGDHSADMTATIHWGDGTSTTGVAVAYNAGTYSVNGSHTYADEGSDPITVDVADVGGSTLTAIGQTTVTVVDAALSDTSAPATPTATEGASTGLLTVATFTDANPGNHSADMTATIHWGDSTSTTGVAVTYNAGTYSVSGSHTYADEGSDPITVDVADDGGSTLTAIGQTTVTVVDAALSDTSAPATPTATEGASTGLLTVATFTDANPGNHSADMTATIHWGDSTSTTGVAVTYNAGTYSVSGSHTYADEGSDPVTVDVADVGGSTLTAIGQTTVTVVDAALSDTSAPATPTATEGASTGLLTVATFTDANPGNHSADMAATIHWGDGTSTTGVAVTYNAGTYSVSGSHTYADEGSDPITVDVNDVGGSTLTAIGQTTVTVVDAALSDTSTPATPTATEGASTGLLTVATFTDANPGNHSADMTATIHWGDGTSTTGVAVTYNAGTYSVSGSHTYADEGSDPITVDVADVGGSTLTEIGQTTVTVVDAPLTGASTATATGAAEGTTVATLAGATFTDANTAAPLSDFTVSAVDWGDGSTDLTGLTVSGSGGNYSVDGTHLYAEEGSHNFKITVTDVGGQTATITGTANVATVPIVGTAVAVSGFEFTPLNNVTVATFTHANGLEPASEFTATIDWGDGTSSSGTVTLSGTNYTVSGSHTYSDEKSYAVKVEVTDAAVSATITPKATILEELLPGGVRGTAEQRFISEVFRDLLDRAVDPSGLAYWTGILAKGVSHYDMVNQLEATTEFENDEVNLLYEKYLHRQVDDSGLQHWTPMLAAGQTVEQVAAQIVGSPEYFQNRGQGTNDGFIDAIYQDALGRAPDASGSKYFGDELSAGVSRTVVALQIFTTDEYKRQVVQYVFSTLLDRPAEPAAEKGFALALEAGMTDEQLAAHVASSDEYFAKIAS